MRLSNTTPYKRNGFWWAVVLDDENPSCNYIARMKGCCLDQKNFIFRCLKCLKEINWLSWPKNEYAKAKCECGQECTLEYIKFDYSVAKKPGD